MAGSAGVSSTSPNVAIRVTHRVVASTVDSLYPLYPLLGVKRLLTPPALGERRHRSLARRRIAVRQRAVLMMPKGQSPHPGASYRRRMYLQDTTDDGAIGNHVIVVIVPVARWAAC